MVVIEKNNNNPLKVSLPRRIATYITSMNFAKVFRRQHRKQSSSPLRKSSEKSTLFPHHHHQYARPFSYHLPVKDQIPPPSSLIKTSPTVPYRVGLSSDSSTLLNNGKTNENDEIVRLPNKNVRGISPKSRKDRRYQSQLNANKRWLFRSMETLDGWKDKVFSSKLRPTNSSQIRSRSVENLADNHSNENILINHNPSLFKQQRAVSPNRSIEAITNRVINAIGIHRQSAQSVPNITRSPALTIEKHSVFTQSTKPYSMNQQMNNSSAIFDFRELSAFGFSNPIKTNINDENETNSLIPSDNILNDINLSDDDDEITNSLSCQPNGYQHTNDDDDNHNEIGDSWDFSITWIDSLKEQHSPQRKIQFYENLIKLLEQDTLSIDELLVLRKILAKIWPIEETNITNLDYYPQIIPTDSKINGTKSLHVPEKIKQRSKLSTMTHHTAQRCSTIMEQATLLYQPLHEQNSGHTTKLSSNLVSAKAKPCFIENNSNQEQQINFEHNYPSHLNPFDERTDVSLSQLPPSEDIKSNPNDSIRRYFERLTLLETIYEKLNIESNKTPEETNEHQLKSTKSEKSCQQNYSPEKQKQENLSNHRITSTQNKSDQNKTSSNKFLEMNVDGNGSISSSKSSIKRRAPTAPHISQNNNNTTMFILSSSDLNVPHRSEPEIHIPIQLQSPNGKKSAEVIIPETTAACDDDGHIFVYDPYPDHDHEGSTATMPRKTERIQQWLSTCEMKSEDTTASQNLSPNSQYKIRCIAKPIRTSSSPQHFHTEKDIPTKVNNEVEPGRFRTSLKIHLETNEPIHPRTRASSATSKIHQRQTPIYSGHHDITDEKYFTQNLLLPTGFQRDHQAVYL